MLQLTRQLPTIGRETLLSCWVGLLVSGAAILVVGIVLSGYGLSHPLGVAAVAALAIAAEREGIQIGPGVEVSGAHSIFLHLCRGCIGLPPPSSSVASACLPFFRGEMGLNERFAGRDPPRFGSLPSGLRR